MVKSGWTIIAIKKSTRQRLKDIWGAEPYKKAYDTALNEALDKAESNNPNLQNQLISDVSQAQIISLVCDLSSLIPSETVIVNAEKKSNPVE